MIRQQTHPNKTEYRPQVGDRVLTRRSPDVRGIGTVVQVYDAGHPTPVIVKWSRTRFETGHALTALVPVGTAVIQ